MSDHKTQQNSPNCTLPKDHAYYEILNQLLMRLDYIRIQPETILLVGWYTDQAEKNLQKRYPKAVIKTARDFKSLHHYENNSVDLIVAHFALPRERDPLLLLQAFFRVLRIEGLLLLTSLGPDTFLELRQNFSTMYDMHHIGDWMRSLYFSDPVMDREEIILAYDDLNLLYDDLNNVGILISSEKWRKLITDYATFKTDDYFPVTLEIIYGHAWKEKLPEHLDELQSEVVIPIDQIKRK